MRRITYERWQEMIEGLRYVSVLQGWVNAAEEVVYTKEFFEDNVLPPEPWVTPYYLYPYVIVHHPDGRLTKKVKVDYV